jgi:hypothetical protein
MTHRGLANGTAPGAGVCCIAIRTGPGEEPGSSLSVRLPTLGVWLSFGLLEPDVAWAGSGSRGLARLEAALPSRLETGLDRASEGRMGSTTAWVVIGMDPPKRTATIEVMCADGDDRRVAAGSAPTATAMPRCCNMAGSGRTGSGRSRAVAASASIFPKPAASRTVGTTSLITPW